MLDLDVHQAIRETLPELVALGLSRGYVTPEDVCIRLPEAEELPGVWALITAELRATDILVCDAEDLAPDAGTAAPDPPASGLDELPSDDPISLYFHEVGAVALLTREEEVDLARRAERGRRARQRLLHGNPPPGRRPTLERMVADGQAAYDHLVKANSRLVIAMAKRFRGQGVPFLDLIQEGNVGLMRAAEKFDYRRGYKFSTYATWWIRQAITRGLANQGRTIRVPVHLSDRIRKLYAISQVLEQELGQAPTPAELAARMGTSEADVRQMLHIARRNLSLERPVGEGQDSELGQLIEDPDSPDPVDLASRESLSADVEEVLLCLTAREARILRLHYGLGRDRPQTLKEIGRKFHLTRERIRQIEQDALGKLRHPRRRERLLGYLE